MTAAAQSALASFWNNQAVPAANLPLVKTAAQAAVALRVHGLLETTGLPSASARLQHASLPNFRSSHSRWADEQEGAARQMAGDEPPSFAIDETESFEHGVVEVEAEGYDVLPLPVPAPERRILCAGSTSSTTTPTSNSALGLPGLGLQQQSLGSQQVYPSSNSSVASSSSAATTTTHSRFRYGGDLPSQHGPQHQQHGTDGLHNPSLLGMDHHHEAAFLGDFVVDDNIDKLREVMSSVDTTLRRCLGATARIGQTRRDLRACHIRIVRGFDSWEGLRGRFVSQRALLRGVAGLEHSKDLSDSSDYQMTDGTYMTLLNEQMNE